MDPDRKDHAQMPQPQVQSSLDLKLTIKQQDRHIS